MTVGMKKLGTFSVEGTASVKKIDVKSLRKGINDTGKHFVSIGEEHKVEYVIDKICNHAGGRLILKDEKAVCPLHGWELDLSNLRYNHSHVCKETLPYRLDSEGSLEVKEEISFLRNPFSTKLSTAAINVRWLNHATVFFEFNGTSVITDPWLLGPAFMSGWWLANPSPIDSIELLQKADFVFVSHNHPDHLHGETLSHCPKNKCIVVPNFVTKSCENSLKALGFTNVNALGFNEIFEIGPKFQLSVLKSGDFRDDSGLYLCADGVEVLLTVDSNFLNNNVLPRHIDLLMTSFASGASGFPICYENFSLEQKNEILKRNKDSVIHSVVQHMRATKPRFYMPYAGMFKEKAPRDAVIREMNVKNELSVLKSIAAKNDIDFFTPDSSRVYQLGKEKVAASPAAMELMPEEDIDAYIAEMKLQNPYDASLVIDYLKASEYQGPQIVQLIPVNDDFTEVVGDIVWGDFKENIFKTISQKDLELEVPGYRVMQLRIRSEVLMKIVKNKLPWEDFSIGFQMRAKRFPNVYESDFWFHFTNIYIA